MLGSRPLRDGLPVLPGAWPLLGHIPSAYRGLPGILRRARAEVGPVYWISLGFGQRVVVCTGPEAVEILRSKSFDSGHLATISPLVAGGSLLGQDGEPHRHLRSAMSGPFLPRGLDAGTVGAMTRDALSSLAARWASRDRVRVAPEIQEATLAVLFRMLGVDPTDLDAWRRRYRALLLANLGSKPSFPGSPAWRAARAKRWIDARLRSYIAGARAAPPGGGLLSTLVHARDDEGRPLADDELVDNLRLLVLGGHETISSTLAWMVITLGHREDLWRELSREAGGAAHVPATPTEARAFPFAEALFRETVRVHPPFGMITRRCEAPFVLHGQTIPSGTLVAVDLWGVSHDPGLFEAPDEIRPARWLSRGGPPSPLEISQFGAGSHFCLGYHLAWLEGVQFAVALSRALGDAGKRPEVRGKKAPAPIFLPTEHPPAGTVVRMVEGLRRG
jgi:cytochrome P450